jgi:hypothetical protein
MFCCKRGDGKEALLAGHGERSKDLPAMRRSVGNSSAIPHVAPIGQTLHECDFMGLHRE